MLMYNIDIKSRNSTFAAHANLAKSGITEWDKAYDYFRLICMELDAEKIPANDGPKDMACDCRQYIVTITQKAAA